MKTPLSYRSVYQLPIPMNGLVRLLAFLTPELTIGDMKAAANQLTLPFQKVVDYCHGEGFDMVILTDLIAFFQRRIQLKKEACSE